MTAPTNTVTTRERAIDSPETRARVAAIFRAARARRLAAQENTVTDGNETGEAA